MSPFFFAHIFCPHRSHSLRSRYQRKAASYFFEKKLFNARCPLGFQLQYNNLNVAWNECPRTLHTKKNIFRAQNWPKFAKFNVFITFQTHSFFFFENSNRWKNLSTSRNMMKYTIKNCVPQYINLVGESNSCQSIYAMCFNVVYFIFRIKIPKINVTLVQLQLIKSN